MSNRGVDVHSKCSGNVIRSPLKSRGLQLLPDESSAMAARNRSCFQSRGHLADIVKVFVMNHVQLYMYSSF